MTRINTVHALRTTLLGSTLALLGGCVLDPISIITDPIMYAADAAGPTEAEYKAQNDAQVRQYLVDHYRGQTCAQITVQWAERKAAVARDSTQWGGPVALSAAEQVAREKGCVVDDTVVTTATAPTSSTSSATPAPVLDAPERDPASFASVIANPPAGWGPTSPKGTRQRTLAQWIAEETPEHYQNRSCDYLNQALFISRQMEGLADLGAQAWGASRRVAVRKVLETKNCPAWTTNGSGRTGIGISSIDPIKAPLLGMPAAGASVERVIPGGNGEKAGLQFTDVVVAVDSTPIADSVDYQVAVGRLPTGATAMLKVWRRSAFINLPIVIGPPLAAPATAAAPVVAAAKSARTTSTPLLDMQIGPVSADYAKAVGLAEAKGAWVIDTLKGGAAERAGLKPLDVIIEVSGQEIATPQDLNVIGSRMREGYKASVIVWRDRARKDLQMVLN